MHLLPSSGLQLREQPVRLMAVRAVRQHHHQNFFHGMQPPFSVTVSYHTGGEKSPSFCFRHTLRAGTHRIVADCFEGGTLRWNRTCFICPIPPLARTWTTIFSPSATRPAPATGKGLTWMAGQSMMSMKSMTFHTLFTLRGGTK